MDKKDIIYCLNKYKSTEFKTKFLLETINYFKNLNNDIIITIEDNEYMLAGIRIYFLYNDDYNFYLAKKPTNNACYRKLKFTANQIRNLSAQIYALKKDKNICSCLKLLDKNRINNGKIVYLLISKTIISNDIGYLLPKLMHNALLGINTMIFLEHQNLDRYCSLYNIYKDKMLVYKEIDDYINIYNGLSNIEKDRIIIFSGLIFHFLGTIYTEDVDILILYKNKDEHEKYKKIFTNFDTSVMLPMSSNKNNIVDDPFPYKSQWFVYKLPRLGGADDLYTMLINPKYHFYFMGVKCIDIYTNIIRTKSRSSGFSLIDIYLLKIFNNIDTEMCIKNLSIRQGEMKVLANYTDYIYNGAKKYLKIWYNIDVSVEYLKTQFKLCNELYDTIYKDSISYADPLIRTQTVLHRFILNFYMEKYAKNTEYLLDIGSGKLSGAFIYKLLKIKNVYGIEPSIYSLTSAKKTIERYKNINFHLIQGYGNKKFDLGVKFDVITFVFTIHYMINNIAVVINNIINHSKKGTIIIITCINGDKLKNKITKIGEYNKGYEIKYNKDIYWGAYELTDPKYKNQMAFYMKDVYGLENGSIEPLVYVDNLIAIFEKNGLKLLENKSFKEIYTESKSLYYKFHLKDFQKEILDINTLLVFSKV